MKIIPAIDIIDGMCVRLSKGDFNTKIIYNENPVEVAKEFEAHGIKNLHLVDLDGAKSGSIVNHKVIENIASQTSLKIDFGGGLKTDKDVDIAFESGASQITGGSIAVNDATKFLGWIKKYGPKKIILGADFNPDPSGDKIAISGWQEESTEDLIPFIYNYVQNGIKYIICTDISKDGMLQGPSFESYQKIIKVMDTLPKEKRGKLIASGGISKFSELPKLKRIGCDGVIIGKAIYEGKISLKQLENFILNTK